VALAVVVIPILVVEEPVFNIEIREIVDLGLRADLVMDRVLSNKCTAAVVLVLAIVEGFQKE
jgi:hypothetical protein